MELTTESTLSPVESEKIPKSEGILVEANTYKTKQVYFLEITQELDNETNNITQGEWHKVKGGLSTHASSEHQIRTHDIAFEVLFNPETKQWLKMIPQGLKEVDAKGLNARLQTSVLIAKAALEIAGLPDLAKQIYLCKVRAGDDINSGFISPHIGPSLEFLVRNNPNNLTPELLEVLAKIYQIAFNQALRLYLEKGYWTDDPNLGNILLCNREDGVHVALIDFTQRHQRADNTFLEAPEERRETQKNKTIARLKEGFTRICQQYRIPFN